MRDDIQSLAKLHTHLVSCHDILVVPVEKRQYNLKEIANKWLEIVKFKCKHEIVFRIMPFTHRYSGIRVLQAEARLHKEQYDATND